MGVIYNIPVRWQGKADEIGERLWERIREFMDLKIKEEDFYDAGMVYTKLLRLLVYLENDLGKGPWSFTQIWWLAHLMSEEVFPL